MRKFECRWIYFWTASFISAFFLIGCGGSVSKTNLFSQSDLEGNRKMIGFGQNDYGPFSNYGSLTVNAQGEITGGGVTNFGIDKQIFTGGTLIISPEGSVTSIIDTFLPDCDASEVQTMPAGQMTLNKNITVHAVNFTLARKGIGILVKKSGDYTVSDLEGTWIFPLEGIFSVSVDNFGAITNCTFLPVEGDAKGCKGNFSITPQGAVSGKIETINGKTFKAGFNGQMNSNKDGMILAGGISTRFEGMATLAIKRQGTFSQADVEGNWKIFISAYNDVLYGTIEVNDSGIITGGDWKTAKARSGTFTKGSFLFTDEGEISGFIKTSTGNTYRIIGGQMSAEKDLVGTMYRDSSKLSSVMMLIKTP